VLGLLLGSGAALIIDRSSGKIYSIDELKAATGLPILGTIPFDPLLEADSMWLQQMQQMTSAQSLPDFSWEDWPQPMKMPFFESFRSLYTTIRLSNPDRPYKTIAISSVTPDSGKTTISFYLALAAATMGKRVLVVDTDLRRPSLHRYANLENSMGLTNMIGESLDYQELVQPLSFEPNLWMLTAGTIPPDPTKIISSEAMEKFVQWAQEKFDIVIYDTPPMLGFADSYLMAAHTDGLLMVANLNDLKRTQLDNVLDQLRVTTSSVIGLVANAVKDDSGIDYAYYDDYQTSSSRLKGLGKMTGRGPFSKKLPAILGAKDWHQ
jgi:capsular exopolysaccharide synthesis family protein